MKMILCQPANLRFQWELEVLLTNIRQFTDMEVVLLFKQKQFTVPIYLRDKYGCSVFVYPDHRDQSDYIPSIRPYLLWQYFQQFPEAEAEEWFYIDSDIIFREWPDFATLPFSPHVVYGADVSGYLNLDYILKCYRGAEIAQKMADICGITVDQMRGVPGIGAQLVLPTTSAAFWERSYHDSNRIYNMLMPMPQSPNPDVKTIQKWTAEMWAQQWGWVREGKVLTVSPELAFSRPTDPIEKWDEFKIMHNAGVLEAGEMFFKGEWVDQVPFGSDFSKISPLKVSSKYVEAIQKVIH